MQKRFREDFILKDILRKILGSFLFFLFPEIRKKLKIMYGKFWRMHKQLRVISGKIENFSGNFEKNFKQFQEHGRKYEMFEDNFRKLCGRIS